MTTNKNPEFYYGGHTFKGVRQFTENEDFHAISKNLCQPVKMRGGWSWNHDYFYRQAETVSGEDFDVFLMDGKYEVVPCQYALHIWGYDMDAKYLEDIKFQENKVKIEKAVEEMEHQAIAYLKHWIECRGEITFNEEDCVICFFDVKGQPISEKVITVNYEYGTLAVRTTDDFYTEGRIELRLSTYLNIIRALKI